MLGEIIKGWLDVRDSNQGQLQFLITDDKAGY